MVRNSNENLLVVASKGLRGNLMPKATELMEACLGLQVSLSMDYDSLILEMDAQEIIRSLKVSGECLDAD